jgi:hypothetical protein
MYSSFLRFTAQLRPWPPPQNPAEFLGGFSTIFFLQGRIVIPTPNPHLGGPDLCIYIPQRQGHLRYKYISLKIPALGVIRTSLYQLSVDMEEHGTDTLHN